MTVGSHVLAALPSQPAMDSLEWSRYWVAGGQDEQGIDSIREVNEKLLIYSIKS